MTDLRAVTSDELGRLAEVMLVPSMAGIRGVLISELLDRMPARRHLALLREAISDLCATAFAVGASHQSLAGAHEAARTMNQTFSGFVEIAHHCRSQAFEVWFGRWRLTSPAHLLLWASLSLDRCSSIARDNLSDKGLAEDFALAAWSAAPSNERAMRVLISAAAARDEFTTFEERAFTWVVLRDSSVADPFRGRGPTPAQVADAWHLNPRDWLAWYERVLATHFPRLCKSSALVRWQRSCTGDFDTYLKAALDDRRHHPFATWWQRLGIR
ncbi:MAG: hypothetical protein EPO40_28250 [Myxococcaceae bacterium]|nr:MAG: hypothetical protein EPO40_28250 [Myxococcaceae bacterium]